MTILMTAILAVLVIAAVCIGAIVAIYNGLVRKRNAVGNAWAQIDVQLNRRHDLIPNLVETVRGYARHERLTFDAVAAARAAAINAHSPAARARAEETLTATVRGIFAVAEAYPQLRSSENFLALQRELSDTENRIAYSRQYYNDAVLTYNNAIETVPTNLIAGVTGFSAREYFDVPAAERRSVQVRF